MAFTFGSLTRFYDLRSYQPPGSFGPTEEQRTFAKLAWLRTEYVASLLKKEAYTRSDIRSYKIGDMGYVQKIFFRLKGIK